MNFLKVFFFILLISFSSLGLKAQINIKEKRKLAEMPPPQGIRVSYIIVDGDTVPVVNLRPVTIQDDRTFSSKREERKWSKLKRDVAKVYPYSHIAGKKLKEYNEKMVNMSEKEADRMLKQAENELKAEFEKDIRNMTLNQGRILIKLIDRETGATSYDLVKDLRGTFQAFFWQSMARFFGSNLKSSYNPANDPEDKMIEEIIRTIEDGTFVN